MCSMNEKKYYAFWLSAICLLVFALQYFIGGFTDLFVLDGSSFSRPWRFVSAIFLHGGIGHLLYNIFALMLFGFILESIIGSRRFLLVFFVSGILANLISVNFYLSSLGASGAIFGVLGALVVARPMMPVWAFSLPMPMFLASILWAFGDLIGVFIPSGVGNIAHLSGLAMGIIFGFVFRSGKKEAVQNAQIDLPEEYMQEWERRNMKR